MCRFCFISYALGDRNGWNDDGGNVNCSAYQILESTYRAIDSAFQATMLRLRRGIVKNRAENRQNDKSKRKKCQKSLVSCFHDDNLFK